MGHRLERLKEEKERRKLSLQKGLIWLVVFLALLGLYSIGVAFVKSKIKPEQAPINQAQPKPKHSQTKPETPEVKQTPVQTPPEEAISIIIGGDVLLDRRVATMIEELGVDEPFKFVSSLLKKFDLVFANLECPLSNEGKPTRWGDCFRGEPEYAKGLKNAGINCLSLANNHILDFGKEALFETISTLDKLNIYHAGAGMNSEEAYAPAVIKIKDKKVSFLAFSYIVPEGFFPSSTKAGIAAARSPFKLVSEGIKKAKKESDLVVCSFHWGAEYSDKIVTHQQELAHLAIDSGADVVFGHHPHVLQGIEIYRGKIVAYSVGNFVYDRYRTKTGEAYLLKFKFSSGKFSEIEIVPLSISLSGQPKIAEEENAQAILERLSSLSEELGTSLKIEGNKGILKITKR